MSLFCSNSCVTLEKTSNVSEPQSYSFTITIPTSVIHLYKSCVPVVQGPRESHSKEDRQNLRSCSSYSLVEGVIMIELINIKIVTDVINDM